MEEIAPFPDDVDDDVILEMSAATFTWEADEEEKIGMCCLRSICTVQTLFAAQRNSRHHVISNGNHHWTLIASYLDLNLMS